MLNEGLNRLWKAYTVTTPDGYTFVMARVVGSNTGEILPDNFGPVLLWHGEYGSGDDWMDINTTSIAGLPTRLFDEGYDVWIAWKRGTYPSQEHIDEPSTSAAWSADDPEPAKKYWDFSLDDIAKVDLPEAVKMIH